MNGIEIPKELEELLEEVPEKHRGILFERTIAIFHPYEDISRRERALTILWGQRNSDDRGHLLESLLYSGVYDDPRFESTPRNDREWEVSCLIAATIIQWLGTPVGFSFVQEAYKKAGWELELKRTKV